MSLRFLVLPKSKQARNALISFLAFSMVITSALTFFVTRIALRDVVDNFTESDGIQTYQPPLPLQNFTLLNQYGEPVTLSDFRGKLALLYFGYTRCPDICPTTLADFRRTKILLGDDAQDVNFVFISVDGRRDTPIAVGEFIRNFDDSFIGLTGEPQTVRALGEDFGLVFEPLDATDVYGNTLVDHSIRSFVVDRNGQLAATFPYGTQPEVMADDLREMLNRG